MYYHVCPYCGANLDPGESCDCMHEIATAQAPRNDSCGGYAKEEAPADVGASTEAGVSME